MNVILFDDSSRDNLLPFTFTRPVCDIRIGIMTIREKWEKFLNVKTSTFTAGYLRAKWPVFTEKGENADVNGSVLPNADLVAEIKALKPMQALVDGPVIIACKQLNDTNTDFLAEAEPLKGYEKVQVRSPYEKINQVWDIFSKNGKALADDFQLLTSGRKSAPISDTNKVLGSNIFFEEGAVAECAVLNSLTGPIYLAKDAEIMEGSVVRGGLALGEHAALKMASKIYGPTTIGPHCKIGGEVNNSVIFGYSNKAHDGFLGNSVIGEWCNLGADTNNSNLKNNYGEVKIYSYVKQGLTGTGLQFCGLFMGDHSKAGINTMFNTGTVVGVNANIFGGGFPPKHIPSFSWGGAEGLSEFKFAEALEIAERVMGRRDIKLTPGDKDILTNIFQMTAKDRH